MSKKIKIKLVKSVIGSNDRIRATIKGLGLRKTNSVSELVDSSSVQGMINKVSHLIKVVNN
jgi:large subunit ribosomal protein L30